MVGGLHVRDGGNGEPVLLLLHGLGATGAVWDEWAAVLAEHWRGRWLAPDLPGHGRSAPLPHYSFGAVAARVADHLGANDQVVVLGHSMGGVVGLALASGWFGVRPKAVVGLGIKVAWTDPELERVRAIAERPVGWYDTREEAAARYLRVSGLADLLSPDHAVTRSGIREDESQWRLAQDPRTFGIGAPDMAGLLAAASGAIVLARGEHDAMVSTAQLTAHDPAAVTLAGLGHNAHVEDPAAVVELVTQYAR